MVAGLFQAKSKKHKITPALEQDSAQDQPSKISTLTGLDIFKLADRVGGGGRDWEKPTWTKANAVSSKSPILLPRSDGSTCEWCVPRCVGAYYRPGGDAQIGTSPTTYSGLHNPASLLYHGEEAAALCFASSFSQQSKCRDPVLLSRWSSCQLPQLVFPCGSQATTATTRCGRCIFISPIGHGQGMTSGEAMRWCLARAVIADRLWALVAKQPTNGNPIANRLFRTSTRRDWIGLPNPPNCGRDHTSLDATGPFSGSGAPLFLYYPFCTSTNEGLREGWGGGVVAV